MARPHLPHEWDGKRPISRADMGITIQVDGEELVYRRTTTGSTPESTTHYLTLGARPRNVRSESSLVDDSGKRWLTGCAYINPKRIFGEGFERMVCWPVGEADARNGREVFHMQLQRRAFGSEAEWTNYRSAYEVHVAGCPGAPCRFKSGVLNSLRWYPEEQPAYEWRARVSVNVSGFSGRPHTVYPDGRVVADD
ncbi:hypothetical protein [Streptomyces sp. NPDC007083]|uniref:hypothetical protein n=1 Tax=Streptomyces sp. NPDC007083 TaxID=3156913 RepID=UPI00340D456B